MRIDPVLKLLRYPYGYHLIPRIELIEKVRLHFLLNNYFSIKMIFKKWGQLQSGRPRGLKLDGPNDWKWAVLSQSGRSAKKNGLEIKKWTVRKNKTAGSKGRSKRLKVDGLIRKTDGLNKEIWTNMRDENGRSKRRVTSMLATQCGEF